MPGYARNRGTAPKRYQCHLCGHLFSRRYNLVTHARVHENARDRPYVCSEPGCGATFYRPPDLLRHATVHSKEKPYQCQDCQKWFTRKDALKRHICTLMLLKVPSSLVLIESIPFPVVKGCQAPTEGL
ncbi:hypothetical protein M427DRAFT_95172 [Gonapodya prolifera JEL478]|uniref:C2H2-type domain-containing protein n=1 Tax=Gonapodya prolifera (strain JEL478) TaxID=1344416 RepID=A0A139AS53_GONPJ|nr:hypothetical protein M427DRAFT_95172 [Gonapodya prolifera JEL478]|eukprot:KXS19539.1 hypothetical protein M427DRAFT_95172 [Gonapodya prolifera JEL478]